MSFIINPYMVTVAAYDSDAQAFFTAAGITNSTQKSAVNQLVLDLKSYSLWTKFIAIYPLVGGTATTHKYNLVDPQDTDGAFRLGFGGGITHDANGITGNGTTGYARTYVVGTSVLSLDDVSAFIYSRTNTAGGKIDLGSMDYPAPNYRSVQINARSATDFFSGTTSMATVDASVANTDSRGLFGVSRLSSTDYLKSINSTQTTITATSTSLSYEGISLMAFANAGIHSAYSDRNLAFACIGSGLTATECDDLYTCVQAYQTTLSRNV